MISLHLRGAKLMISIHLRGAKLYDPPPLRVQIYLGRFFKRSFLYGVEKKPAPNAATPITKEITVPMHLFVSTAKKLPSHPTENALTSFSRNKY